MNNPSDLPSGDPGIRLTEPARDHFKKIIQHQPNLVGVRISVKKAGCSGYEYILTLATADDRNDFDFVFDFEDFQLFIDKEIYLKFIKGGTTVDFKKEGINEGLKFDNPNVGHQCGCGESFTLTDDE